MLRSADLPTCESGTMRVFVSGSPELRLQGLPKRTRLGCVRWWSVPEQCLKLPLVN